MTVSASGQATQGAIAWPINFAEARTETVNAKNGPKS